MAEDYLKSSGYEILETNFYSRHGEIDLIARDDGCLVFVEVKYRKDSNSGYPWEAVNTRKQKSLYYTARYYMLTHGYDQQAACRFDVISILGKDIQHFKNAFMTEGI